MIIGMINDRFPGELSHTNAKSAILPIALSGLTGASGTWTSNADNASSHQLDIKATCYGLS